MWSDKFNTGKNVGVIDELSTLEDLGIDSLDAIEIQVWLEDSKNFVVDDTKTPIRTVTDFLQLIK